MAIFNSYVSSPEGTTVLAKLVGRDLKSAMSLLDFFFFVLHGHFFHRGEVASCLSCACALTLSHSRLDLDALTRHLNPTS